MGQILNTNAKYISTKLADMGVTMYHQTTVGDNAKRLEEAILTAKERSDVVILTGGLGPTGDDLTKETAAKCLGKELVLIDEQYEILKARFDAMHKSMTLNNNKQATFPLDAIILPNPNGTAPGCIMEDGGKALILLPGPPRELFPMFDNHVTPYLEKRVSGCFHTRVMRIFGIGESSLEQTIIDIINEQSNPTVAPYALTGEVTLRVTAACANHNEGEALVMPMIERIKQRIGDVVYSIDDEPLEAVCAKLLKKHGRTLATCESCTGGMIASTLVNLPGSSEWFEEGCVTYSNQAKQRRANVNGETLSRFGAVSEQTAAEMAQGMRETSGADYALSVTGIAGPAGGSTEKPVGLVYIGLAYNGGVDVKELRLSGDRFRIRHISMLNALDMLRRKLIEMEEK